VLVRKSSKIRAIEQSGLDSFLGRREQILDRTDRAPGGFVRYEIEQDGRILRRCYDLDDPERVEFEEMLRLRQVKILSREVCKARKV